MLCPDCVQLLQPHFLNENKQVNFFFAFYITPDILSGFTIDKNESGKVFLLLFIWPLVTIQASKVTS